METEENGARCERGSGTLNEGLSVRGGLHAVRMQKPEIMGERKMKNVRDRRTLKQTQTNETALHEMMCRQCAANED